MTPAPEELVHEADAARARLLEVVDALDAKRHKLKSPPPLEKPSLARELALPLGAAGAGAAALGGAVFVKDDRIQALLRTLGIALLSLGVFESIKSWVK